MGKSHPIALRERVIAFVEEGQTHREAARHFRVSPRFVNNMVILKRETGSLLPRRQEHLGGGKLAAHHNWIAQQLAQNGELTLDELCVELVGRGVIVHRSSVCRLLHRLGLSHKKSLMASERQRPEIAQARELWIGGRRPFFNKGLAKLVFIDETSTNTKLTKRSGWSPRGQRYRAHLTFGSWQSQTFIAGLRSHEMVAPWIVDRPMNGSIFEAWIEAQLAPTMSRSTKANGPQNWFKRKEHGCCSSLLTVLISIPSRWPSQSSRHYCENSPPAASTPLQKLSGKSAICSLSQNAETTSRLQDMRQIKCDML